MEILGLFGELNVNAENLAALGLALFGWRLGNVLGELDLEFSGVALNGLDGSIEASLIEGFAVLVAPVVDSEADAAIEGLDGCFEVARCCIEA